MQEDLGTRRRHHRALVRMLRCKSKPRDVSARVVRDMRSIGAVERLNGRDRLSGVGMRIARQQRDHHPTWNL